MADHQTEKNIPSRSQISAGCHVSLLRTKVWWILVLVGCQIITFGENWRDSLSLSLSFLGATDTFPGEVRILR
jgi:hypothetical protein